MTISEVPLCAISDLLDGQSRGAAPDKRGRDRIILIRRAGDIHAYLNYCPHYDRAPLGWRKNEFLNGERTRIMCAAHGALFDIENGECVLGPCLGDRLTSVELIVKDGWIFGLDIPATANIPRPEPSCAAV